MTALRRTLRLLLLAALPFALPVRAQYEQLLKEPPPPTPAPGKPATPPPPAPRLLPPSLHKQKIAFLDQSADGAWLLTADASTLRLWEAGHRANVVTLRAKDNERFDFAGFTADDHDLLVQTGGYLRRYRGLPGDEAFDQIYLTAGGDRLFHRPTNTFIAARFEPANPHLLIVTTVHAGEKFSVRRFELNLYATHKESDWLAFDLRNGLSLDASGRFLGLSLTQKAPFAVIDLQAGTLVVTVPANRNPVGLAPDGTVLLQNASAGRASFVRLDPIAGTETPAFETAVDGGYVSPVLPRRHGDPLLIVTGRSHLLHDFATGTTSVPLNFDRRTFDRVIVWRDRTRTLPLIAMSVAAPTGGGMASTHLEFMDAASGDGRGPWVTETFAPGEIFARADDFEFLVRRGLDLRRVRVTEAGLQIDPVAFKEGVLFPRNAHYDRESETWRFVGSGSATLHTPAADTGIYAGRSLGAQNAKTGPNTIWFNSTHASAVSRDGRVLALHHGAGVQVVDVATGRATATFTDPKAVTYHDAAPPGIALSPDATAVVFTYTYHRGNDRGYRTECRELPSGELRWSSETVRGPFAFNPDGSRVYAPSFTTMGGWVELYASTGEIAAQFSGDYVPDATSTFNAAGTLLAVASNRTLRVYALPGGKPVASIKLDSRPSALAFVGSDRFLLANAANDEQLRLFDLKDATTLAEIHLFESPQKWLVLHPATGLFSSEVSVHKDLQFAVGPQITPLASYLDEFYRPRLLGSLVKGLVPRPAVALADLRHAPKLTLKIDGPATRGLTVEDEFETFEIPAPEVTLRLEASCEGSPVADLRIYHNGKLVAGATRGLTVEDDEDAVPDAGQVFTRSDTRTLALTPGKNRFRAVALNAQGTESVPDEIVVWSQAAPPADESAGTALHVVTVGIDVYRNPTYNLNYARADAAAVDALLRARLGRLFSRVRHHTLYDAEATRENILATLEAVKREAGPRDAFIFYYAGHGVMSDDADPEFHLAPHDITQLYGERRLLRQLGIPGRDLLDASRDIAAQKQLFILDACQSAGALKSFASRGAVEERAIAQLARSTGTHWLTATGSEQFATEFAKLGHGAFTKVLLDALEGAADAGDGIVTVNELKAYVEAKVPELTAAEKGQAQYPVTYGYGQDFPLTVVNPNP
jgi:hypothetical protein